MSVLIEIKRLALLGLVEFTEKALDEMETDGLRDIDILESLVSAKKIDKVLRSRSDTRRLRDEKLYVIKSRNFAGTLIYTKGKILKEAEGDRFYILVSSKVAFDT